MIIKLFKPITPSLRFLKQNKHNDIIKILKLKHSTKGISRSFGKTNKGHYSSYHKGGGHKRIYRFINKYPFKQGIIESFEYDPYRSSFLVRIFNINTEKSFYQLASEHLKLGDILQYIPNKFESSIGCSCNLKYIPIGALIHNITFHKNSKSKVAIAAGTYAQVIQQTENFTLLKLTSGEIRYFPNNSIGTFGRTANSTHKLQIFGKAGRIRWLNKRPTVRGVAMNPIDHPHGGGQGKTGTGRPCTTPWGKLTKGVPTSKYKNKSYLFLSKNKAKKLL